MKKITAYQLVLSFLLLIIFLLLVFFGITYKSFQSTISESIRDSVNLKMMRSLEGMLTNLTDLESAQRGYMLAEDARFIKDMEKQAGECKKHLAELQQLKRNDTGYNKAIDKLSLLVNNKLNFILSQTELMGNGKKHLALGKSKSLAGLMMMEDIKAQVFFMEEEGRTLLRQSAAEKKYISERANQYFIYLTTAVTIILFIFYFRIRHDLNKRIAAENKLAILNDDLSKQVKDKTVVVQETESLYATLIEQAADGIFLADSTFKYIDVNGSACRMLGFTKEELLTKTIQDITMQDKNDLPFRFEELQKGKTVLQERRMRKKDGQILPVEINAQLLPNGNFLATVRDISARKEREKKLETQERQLRLFVENSPVAEAMFDTNMNYIAVSKRWTAENHLQNVNIIGKNHYDVVPGIPERWKEIHRRCLAGATEKNELDSFEHPDGSIDWLHWEVSPWYNDEGEIGGLFMYTELLNEKLKMQASLQEKEQQYSLLIDRLTDGFIWLDKNWNYKYANKKIGEMTKYDPGYLIGKNVWDLFPYAVDTPTYNLLQQVMKQQVYGHNIDYSEKLDLWMENHAYPAEDGIYVFIRDISEAKRAEGKLAASEKNLRYVLSSSTDGFYVIDTEGTITILNDKASYNLTKAWGIPVKKGTNIMSLLPDEEQEPVRESLQKVFAGHKVEYELKLQHRDLPEWVTVSYQPVKDESNKVIGAYIATKDITEKKLAQLQLEESERNLRQILSSNIGSFFVVDKNYCFRLFNEKAVRDFKTFSGKEISAGMKITDFIPADRKEVVVNHINKAFAGETVEYERQFNFEGLTDWYAVSYLPVKDEGANIYAVYISFIDISERKWAEMLERKTNEQQALFTSIVNSSDDAIISKTLDGLITSWNTAAEKMLGYESSEIIGRNIRHIIPEDRLAEEDYIIAKIREGNHVRHFETIRKRKDGTLIDLSITVSPILNHDGVIIGASKIARDITERKKAEQAILLANRRFMLISKATKDFVWDHDLIENTVWWNDNFYKVLGWDKKVESPEVNSWEKNIHAEDQERIFKRLNDILYNSVKSVWTDEYRFRKSDGNYIYVFDRGFIMRNTDGKPYRMLGAMTDITSLKEKEMELRRSEQKYKILFENNPMPLWMFENETRRFVAVNEAAVNRYGYTKEEFLNMTINDIRPGNEVERLNTFLPSRHRDGVVNAGIWRHLKKDGTEILAEVFSHETLYDGKLVRLVLPIDVTEKIRAEQELFKSREDIRNLASHLEEVREEERTGIAREIHDELGQQLTVLKMDTSWLSKNVTKQDEKIIHRIKEMGKVIDETVKTIQRISSELRPRLLDNLGIVAAMEWQCKEFQERTGIVINFSAAETVVNLPVKTANGLFRIFQESLTNIARHSQATQADVTLNLSANEIILLVEDNGIGFIKEKINGKRTLGMLGMRERALLLNGECKINSKPGQGTLVEVIIPLT